MNVKTEFRSNSGNDKKLNQVLKPLFIAWVRNKLVPIHFMFQKPEIQRSPERIQAVIKTIYELCGHFCYDEDYQHYFFHLISLLEKFPNLTKKELGQGFEDVRAILKLFSVELEEEKGGCHA